MLIDFSVENFRSYHVERKFSLVASPAKEHAQNLRVHGGTGLSTVSVAAIYGPNASGKSNLLAAMYCLGEILISPVERSFLAASPLTPFALTPAASKQPTRFRVRFLLDGVLCEYDISARPSLVEEERFTAYPAGRPQEWFHRVRDEIVFSRTHLKGPKQRLQGVTAQSQPFLAVAAAFDHPQLSVPARWLASNLRDRFANVDYRPRMYRGRAWAAEQTARLCREDKQFHEWANALLRHADLGIGGVEIEVTQARARRPVAKPSTTGAGATVTYEEVMEEHVEPYFVHSGAGKFTARFGLVDESHGTRRLFAMLAPLYTVIQTGQLAVVDELDASLHPSLTKELIRFFNDPTLNPKGAQLIFTTHDASLLSSQDFRRDQVWFTEKAANGATTLYSLHDIKGVREGDSFEKGYLRGRYGAIPFFGQFDFPPVPEGQVQEDPAGPPGVPESSGPVS